MQNTWNNGQIKQDAYRLVLFKMKTFIQKQIYSSIYMYIYVYIYIYIYIY